MFKKKFSSTASSAMSLITVTETVVLALPAGIVTLALLLAGIST